MMPPPRRYVDSRPATVAGAPSPGASGVGAGPSMRQAGTSLRPPPVIATPKSSSEADGGISATISPS